MPKIFRFLKKSEKYFILVLAILPLIWVSIWFKNGKMFAGGEEGLPFYNLQRMANLSKYTWLEVGTGLIEPSVLPRYPTYYLLSQLQKIGFNSTQVQEMFFLILLEISAISFYFLGLEIFSNRKEKYLISFIAAIFYITNPFSMGSVWGRFLFTLIELQALLPIFLLFFIKGMENNKYSLGFLAAFSALLLSYSFAAPASIFTIWIPCFIYFIYSVIKNGKFLTKFIYVVVTGIFWFMLHSWWLLPLFSTYNIAYKEAADILSNLASAEGVSRVNNLGAVIRLINKSYYYIMEVWGSSFKSVPFQLISWILPILAIIGTFFVKQLKSKNFLTILFIVSLFLANGPNSPLGWLFKVLFKAIPFFSSLRNPFEKSGIILSLSISLLAAFSTVGLSNRVVKKFGWKQTSIIILLISIVYAWPMWTGYVIGGRFPAKTLIPKYYDEANLFLNKNIEDSKIVVLPITQGNGATYNWPDGIYSGIEPSFNLFPSFSIGQGLNLESTQNIAKGIYAATSNNIEIETGKVGAKYVVLRNDINWKASGTISPKEVLKVLIDSKKFEKIGDFGQLEIWKSNDLPIPLFSIFKDPSNITKSLSIKYQKLNPTHYQLKIDNSSGQQYLSFNQTYSPNWQAKVNGKILDNMSLNQYSNNYKIPDGIFDLVLEYKIEEYKLLGIRLAMVGIVLGILLIFIDSKFLVNRYSSYQNAKK